jgi:beta-lactam-binding protein with PASTA domain
MLIAVGGFLVSQRFDGPDPPITVPKLVGRPLETAREKIAAASLGHAELSYEETRDLSPESVLRQAPEPGTLVAAGTRLA